MTITYLPNASKKFNLEKTSYKKKRVKWNLFHAQNSTLFIKKIPKYIFPSPFYFQPILFIKYNKTSIKHCVFYGINRAIEGAITPCGETVFIEFFCVYLKKITVFL
jgi:hypothetical protein